MRLWICIALLSTALCESTEKPGLAERIMEAGEFVRDAVEGAKDMFRAYMDMRGANYIGADKYFHARGNYEAAKRGSGGAWAAKLISDLREAMQTGDSGRGDEDSRLDQEANEWGRRGGDPNRYRPKGLPSKY